MNTFPLERFCYSIDRVFLQSRLSETDNVHAQVGGSTQHSLTRVLCRYAPKLFGPAATGYIRGPAIAQEAPLGLVPRGSEPLAQLVSMPQSRAHSTDDDQEAERGFWSVASSH